MFILKQKPKSLRQMFCAQLDMVSKHPETNGVEGELGKYNIISNFFFPYLLGQGFLVIDEKSSLNDARTTYESFFFLSFLSFLNKMF